MSSSGSDGLRTYSIEFGSFDLRSMDGVFDGGDALVVGFSEDEIHFCTRKERSVRLRKRDGDEGRGVLESGLRTFQAPTSSLGEEEVHDRKNQAQVDHCEDGIGVFADGVL